MKKLALLLLRVRQWMIKEFLAADSRTNDSETNYFSEIRRFHCE